MGGYEREKLWQTLRFAPVDLDEPRVARLIEVLRGLHVNGGAFVVGGAAADAAAFDRVIAQDWRRDPAFFRLVLALPFVAAVAPGLRVRESAALEFERGSSLTLDGELATALVKGGAYDGWRGAWGEAKALGQGFCAALFGERYEEVEVFASREPWAEWFRDVAWDQTWIVIDRALRRVIVLGVTDTD